MNKCSRPVFKLEKKNKKTPFYFFQEKNYFYYLKILAYIVYIVIGFNFHFHCLIFLLFYSFFLVETHLNIILNLFCYVIINLLTSDIS